MIPRVAAVPGLAVERPIEGRDIHLGSHSVRVHSNDELVLEGTLGSHAAGSELKVLSSHDGDPDIPLVVPVPELRVLSHLDGLPGSAAGDSLDAVEL